MNIDYLILGQIGRVRRERLGLTQTEFAAKAKGLCQSTVSRFESGTWSLSFVDAVEFAGYLDLTVADLTEWMRLARFRLDEVMGTLGGKASPELLKGLARATVAATEPDIIKSKRKSTRRRRA